MGLFTKRKSIDQLEQERHADEIHQLADLAFQGIIPIAETKWRDRVKVVGHVKAMRVQPWAEQVDGLELTLTDSTGGITLVFFGRRRIGGIHLGSKLMAEGTTSEHHGLLTILNPQYLLLPNEIELPY